jgi:hypothetical protein
MPLTPDAARTCAGCSTPLAPGSTTCATCGRDGSAPRPGPGEQPGGPAGRAPVHPPRAPMVQWPQNPGPPPPAMPPAGAVAMPPPYGYPGGTVRVVAAKSPGIAVVLSIWLGVGHLYVGANGLGFGLLAYYLFLCLLSFVPILWILTVPVWFVSFVFVAMNASKAAHDFNRRNGVTVH